VFGLAWATLDAANLAALPVLGGIEALTVVSDHDPPNAKTGIRPGNAAAEECARRWARAGVEVRVWTSPTPGTDLNDFARAGAAA
jgi:putative DNA primase/helicase